MAGAAFSSTDFQDWSKDPALAGLPQRCLARNIWFHLSRLCSVPPLKMPALKMAKAAQQQQSSASGAAFGEYLTKQRDVAPLFATNSERP
jgi:hypothetical protein